MPVSGNWTVPVPLLADTRLRLGSVSDFLRRCGWQADDDSVGPAVEVEGQLQRRAGSCSRACRTVPPTA